MLSPQTIGAAQCWFLQSYLFKNTESFSLKNQAYKIPKSTHSHLTLAVHGSILLKEINYAEVS